MVAYAIQLQNCYTIYLYSLDTFLYNMLHKNASLYSWCIERYRYIAVLYLYTIAIKLRYFSLKYFQQIHPHYNCLYIASCRNPTINDIKCPLKISLETALAATQAKLIDSRRTESALIFQNKQNNNSHTGDVFGNFPAAGRCVRKETKTETSFPSNTTRCLSRESGMQSASSLIQLTNGNRRHL